MMIILKPNTSAYPNPTSSWTLELVAWTNLIKTVYVITSKNCNKELEKYIGTYLNNFGKWFIKFVHAILPKSKKTITDYQLNSFLENCIKTQLQGVPG